MSCRLGDDPWSCGEQSWSAERARQSRLRPLPIGHRAPRRPRRRRGLLGPVDSAVDRDFPPRRSRPHPGQCRCSGAVPGAGRRAADVRPGCGPSGGRRPRPGRALRDALEPATPYRRRYSRSRPCGHGHGGTRRDRRCAARSALGGGPATAHRSPRGRTASHRLRRADQPAAGCRGRYAPRGPGRRPWRWAHSVTSARPTGPTSRPLWGCPVMAWAVVHRTGPVRPPPPCVG